MANKHSKRVEKGRQTARSWESYDIAGQTVYNRIGSGRLDSQRFRDLDEEMTLQNDLSGKKHEKGWTKQVEIFTFWNSASIRWGRWRKCRGFGHRSLPFRMKPCLHNGGSWIRTSTIQNVDDFRHLNKVSVNQFEKKKKFKSTCIRLATFDQTTRRGYYETLCHISKDGGRKLDGRPFFRVVNPSLAMRILRAVCCSFYCLVVTQEKRREEWTWLRFFFFPVFLFFLVGSYRSSETIQWKVRPLGRLYVLVTNAGVFNSLTFEEETSLLGRTDCEWVVSHDSPLFISFHCVSPVWGRCLHLRIQRGELRRRRPGWPKHQEVDVLRSARKRSGCWNSRWASIWYLLAHTLPVVF